MSSDELAVLLRQEGRDASRSLFEDELTGIHNRRFLLGYLKDEVRWKSGEDFPVSLLMLDVDRLEGINDTHGQEAGDQVLIWLADILWSEAAGRKALPVRYAGDEFTILALGASPADARQMAERIIERIGDTPFELGDGASLTPEISLGIATAPGDARDPRELVHRAHAALCQAKRSGRNRAAAAAETESERVFTPLALERLEAAAFAGRQAALGLADAAVQALGAGTGSFLLFEGAPGLGKTTLLDAIERRLPHDAPFLTTRVSGNERDALRPYSVAARALVGLLEQRQDRGAALLDGLPSRERGLLSRVLPALSGGSEALDPPDSDDPGERRALFDALASLLPRVTDARPLLLLIDDLPLADEATLLLLGALFRKPGSLLAVCATGLEAAPRAGTPGTLLDPDEGWSEGIEISRSRLQPLSAGDIADHLGSVFPGVELPAGLADQLGRITRGDPQFLAQIVHQLAAAGKVAPGARSLRLLPLDDRELPRSLEELVAAKIATLGSEQRGLLEHASVLGEQATLSVLSGTAQMPEARVLDFLDRARGLGLVSLDFRFGDETLRFLGKRVLDGCYGSIDPARRGALHERAGDYLEGVCRRVLGPSAAILAHHFGRSPNREKAARYERLRRDHARSVFEAAEAASYAGEPRPAEADRSAPGLAPGSLQLVPEVLRAFMAALRQVRLDPGESEATVAAQRALRHALDRVLADNPVLVLRQESRMLYANDQRVEISEARLMTASFLQTMSRVDLGAIHFERGFSDDELRSLIRAINAVHPEVLDRGYWRRFSREHAMRGIALAQLGLARPARREAAPATLPPPPPAEGALGDDDWKEVSGVLRALLAALRAIRLYSIGSRPVSDAVAQLEEALRGVLERRGALTLALVQGDLLINGLRPGPAELAPLAARLRQQLESLQLDSLGFYRGVQADEILTAIGAVRQLPPELDRSFWSTFARAHGLEKVAFNVSALPVEVETSRPMEPPPLEPPGTGADAPAAAPPEGGSPPAAAAAAAPPRSPAAPAAGGWSERSLESLLDGLPELGRELLVRGAHEQLHTLLERLFAGYGERETGAREALVDAFAHLLSALMPAQQNQLTRLSLEAVLGALAREAEPRVLVTFTRMLHRMAAAALPFSQHAVAARIFTSLTMRQLELEEAGRIPAEQRLLEQALDPDVALLLTADLRSGDPERQERAADVLGSLGRLAIPPLVDVVKEEKQLRIGLLAASILAGLGPEAEAEIKRQMVLEVTVEQRFRIIELVDQVTRDVIDELALCIGDPNPKIRRAAYRLAERLRDARVVDVLIEHARDDDIGPAKGALRSLGAVGTEEAVAGLVKVLEGRPEAEWAVACAQALGQSAHPAAIEALARLLGERKGLVFGHRWSDQVRATAAFALARIDDVRAREALAVHARDSDSRVRRAAAASAAGVPLPEPAEPLQEPAAEAASEDAGEPPAEP